MANPAVTYDRDGTWLWHGQSFAEHVAAAQAETKVVESAKAKREGKPGPIETCWWTHYPATSPYYRRFWKWKNKGINACGDRVENRGSQPEEDAPLLLALELVGG